MRLFVLLIVLLSTPLFAQEKPGDIIIDVGQAAVKKSLMAFPPPQYIGTQKTNAAHIQVGQNLYRVIVNDLTVSNFFTFIKPEAFLEDTNKVGMRPAPGDPNGFKFDSWKTIGAEFLVRSSYSVVGNDLSFEVYVYHVPTTRVVLSKNYKGATSSYRRMAHTFANDLVKALTGKRGMFISKITASRQTPGDPVKEIYLMDWDGAAEQKITTHQSIALSPTWSTTGDKIAYTAFAFHKAQKMRNSDLFFFEIATGKRWLVSYRKGLNSGAAFFPGDKNFILTLSKDGSADLFRATADGQTVTPLTKGPNRAMNVEAAISPDGKQVAFSSDRSGRPMIYLMNADGSNVRRLTLAGKYNASPAWSPDGKTLAFAGQDKGHFDIFTMNTDGSNLKRLTDATKPNGKPANNESPSWSPDGRNIVFTSDRTGNLQLYIVSPDGTNERRITEDKHNWDKPKWSPFLD
ncbi:MAG: PD40 domain-containing protein [Bdellovibrionales bacterium]|nr:PD40 domain-containing protein [Bdellovibrionales bacterium]